MLGSKARAEFKPDEYNEFYTDHKFEPLDEHTAMNVDLVLPRATWAMDVAKEIKAESLLDLCCLDGFVALTLGHKLGIAVTGVDLSEPGIKLAYERATKYNLNAVFVNQAIETYKGGKFDLITLFEAIEHFQDVDKVMAMIKAHLKPGGTLLVSTPEAEGKFGIPNVQDICHLIVWTTKHKGELPYTTPEGKPIRSLPDYLEEQGFTIIENEVYNELVCVRAMLN